jgi:polyisoprenoid-binding protein YceI
MSTRRLLAFAVPLAGLLAAAAALPAAPAAPPVPAAPAAPPAPPALPDPAAPTTYTIDGGHSSVVFRIQHMGVSYFYGRFNQVDGQFTVADDPAQCAIEIQVAAESVDTAIEKRDDHIRSPDFLNASEFPEIRFKSETVKAGKDGALEITGPFTLHGETRPITVTAHKVGEKEGSRGKLAGYEAVFTFRRSEFGMDQMLDSLGDEVRIHLGLEGRGE